MYFWSEARQNHAEPINGSDVVGADQFNVGTQMRSAFKASTMVVCVLTVTALAYTRYWENKYKPIADLPGVSLEAERFTPEKVAKTQSLNLGYAQISVPKVDGGELVRVSSSNFLCWGVSPTFPILFCPPRSGRDKDVESVFQSIAALDGHLPRNWFEFEKLELSQKPGTVWQLASLGKQKASVRLALLTLKSAECSTTSSVRIYENDHIGLIVWNRRDRIRVLIADIKSGISQEILIEHSIENPESLISAMANDYKTHLTDSDIGMIGRMIENEHLRVVPRQGT